jgi:predicted protein tyrosine phosphatase
LILEQHLQLLVCLAGCERSLAQAQIMVLALQQQRRSAGGD